MKYIKLDNDPTMWLLQDSGKRLSILDMADLYKHGLYPVEIIPLEEMESYPVEKVKNANA